MKKIKKVKFNKIAALAIIVSVSGSGSPAFAINSSNNKSPYTNTINVQHYEQSLPNLNIDRLSITGTVSKSQKAYVSNLFAAYKASIIKAIKDNFSSKLDRLIDLGTITNLQKTEVMNLYIVSDSNKDELIGINSLVKNKTITKDQKTIILNTFINSKISTSKTINNILLSKLDKLISNKVINEVQRTSVINLTKNSFID
jgi:hypothetical protein